MEKKSKIEKKKIEKNPAYKNINSSKIIIEKNNENCGKTCNNKICFCGKI